MARRGRPMDATTLGPLFDRPPTVWTGRVLTSKKAPLTVGVLRFSTAPTDFVTSVAR